MSVTSLSHYMGIFMVIAVSGVTFSGGEIDTKILKAKLDRAIPAETVDYVLRSLTDYATGKDHKSLIDGKRQVSTAEKVLPTIECVPADELNLSRTGPP